MQRNIVNIYQLLLLVILGVLPGSAFCQVSPKEAHFRAPLNLSLLLSGNFGEVRSNHFHSGIDIKTEGQTGKPVYAVADGYISRIKVEPGGYGKAVYMKHPNGYTSVYGHLHDFDPEIRNYVFEQQYKRKSFSVDLYPEAGRFSIKEGDIIAFSGNSGSSMGPHLHFELRDSQTENPVNPLLYSFEIKDNIPPVIYSINIYSLEGRQDLKKPDKYRVSGSNGKYNLTGTQPVPVDELFGIGIETIDFLDGSSNKCGVFSIKLLVDDELYFHSKTDEFSFAESRYINSLVDYRQFRKEGSSMYRTFLDPNNHLSILQFVKNKGVISFADYEPHRISLVTEDVAGNLSSLDFMARRDSSLKNKSPEKIPLYNAYFSYSEANTFEDENIIVEMPAKATYNNIYFRYESAPGGANTYSRVHKVHDADVPVHKNFTLKIKPESLPERLKPYALIARIQDNYKSAAGGSWKNGYLVTSTRTFGNYTIMVDTVAPVIKPLNFTSGRDLLNASQIRFSISDNFSGIARYTGKIDGEWVLFEWDPKNNLIFHDLTYRPLDKTKAHLLELEVVDDRGNIQKYSTEIK